MNIEFHILGLKAHDRLRNQLASDLHDLNDLIPIAHADITLVRQRDSTPPFQSVVLLGVPGPDIHAAARDHTWPAAWRKVIARLRQQMEDRRSRQEARLRRPRDVQMDPGRPTGSARVGRP